MFTVSPDDSLSPTPPATPQNGFASFLSSSFLTIMGLAVLSGVFAIWAYWMQVTVWNNWDDEGYVMVTLARFFHNKPLYTDVYSQYGPAYYLLQWLALAPFSHHVTHDAMRWETIIIWITVTFLGSVTAYRLTQSPVTAVLAHLLCASALWRLVDEPGHPQGLCVLLLAVAAVLLTFLDKNYPRRTTLALGGIGLCIGLLIATKVNLGIYFGLAALLTLLVLAPVNRRVNIVIAIIGPTFLSTIVLYLVRNNLTLEWVRYLALSVVAGGSAAFLAGRYVFVKSHASGSSLEKEPFPVLSLIAPAVVGALLGIVLPALFVVLRGTPVAALWQGMVGQHLGFDRQFILSPVGSLHQEVEMTTRIRYALLLSFLYALLVLSINRAKKRTFRLPITPSQATSLLMWILVIARFAVGMRAFIVLLNFKDPRYLLQILPVLWLVALPLHLTSLPDAQMVFRSFLPRLFLILLAILEGLWVYPAAGTQLSMASYLPVLLCAVSVGDSLKEAQAALRRYRLAAFSEEGAWFGASPKGAALSALGAIGLFLLGGCYYGWHIVQKTTESAKTIPLGLPGARLIRLEPAEVMALQDVTNYLTENSDTVVMLPGMYSFYFWMKREPTIGLNAGAWPILFNREQQEKLVAFYRSQSRSGRVVGLTNRAALDIWIGPDRHPTDETHQPLYEYISNEFVPVKRCGEFFILKPKSGNPAP